METRSGCPSTSAPLLSTDQIRTFRRDGFLVLRRVTTGNDLAVVAGLLSGLYARYDELARRRRAFDLGGSADGIPRILEINQTIQLEPALARTETFARCRDLAEALLQRPVQYRFDHAIYKPPYNGAATAWHQDEAYTVDPNFVTAHFWVPMSDVNEAMGCMQFIPGSHRDRLRRHHRRDYLRQAHALEVDDVDPSTAVVCPLAAGDVTVHVPRTLHGTGPNQTPRPRLAWSLEFGPRRALGFRVIAKARVLWRRTVRA